MRFGPEKLAADVRESHKSAFKLRLELMWRAKRLFNG